MLHSVGAVARYFHTCVFKAIDDLAKFWAVICECCPGFFVSVSVIVFVVVVMFLL